MSLTGGELNALNGRFGISAPHRSVPVMQLIRIHQPQSKAELVDLILHHAETRCPCGIVSKGSIDDFGKALYKAQQKAWGEYRYSLSTCIQWEYDLFITQSMKGNAQEKKLLNRLRKQLPQYTFSTSSSELDAEWRIDIVIERKGATVGGIQVKPHTFSRARPAVIAYQKSQHRKWEFPVLAAVYNTDSNWVRFEALVEQIKNL